MKHGRKPSVKQAKLLTENNYNYKEWLVIKITADGVTFCHKETKEIITLL